MAGKPKPIPDDRFEKFAKMLIKICGMNKQRQKQKMKGQSQRTREIYSTRRRRKLTEIS